MMPKWLAVTAVCGCFLLLGAPLLATGSDPHRFIVKFDDGSNSDLARQEQSL